MAFYVSRRCPECGAPMRHLEGAITFKCEYCKSVLRAQNEGATLTYIISARLKREEVPATVKRAVLAEKMTDIKTLRKIVLLQKPFWYCKGLVYFASVQNGFWSASYTTVSEEQVMTQTKITRAVKGTEGEAEVDAKLWIHSFPASALCPSFLSLGIQSEVLTLEQFDREEHSSEVILPVDVPLEQAKATAEKRARESLGHPDRGMDYSLFTFIGEEYFIIYYPVVAAVCEGKEGFHTLFLDGVNGQFLHDERGNSLPDKQEKEESLPLPKVASHRCANCGQDLEPRDFDLVFYCANCFQLWMLKGNDYVSLEKKVLGADGDQYGLYLPFWKFTATLKGDSGPPISKVGEFAKLMKAGEYMLRAEDPEKQLTFYLPAILPRNPGVVLKLAVRVSRAQRTIPQSLPQDLFYSKFKGASMPTSEAREMLPVVVFSVIGRVDRRAAQFYRTMEIITGEPELVWYPFNEKGDMLSDAFFQFNIAKRGVTDDLH